MTQQSDGGASRIEYLESIRGLASVQVLLLHCFAAFVPDLVYSLPAAGNVAGYIHLSPLYFLYDGYSAVYVFFVLSGFVLTRSFARQVDDPISVVAARALRLGIPALSAVIAAAIVLALFGRQNVAAAALTGSDWFATQWNPELSFLAIVRDGVINALVLGYSNLPGVQFTAPLQQPVEQSFLAPLWTLSVEFYGSLLILLLCICHKQSRTLWWIVSAAAAIFLCRSAYICFLLGHVAAVLSFEKRTSHSAALPATGILLGIFLCISADIWQPQWLRALCSIDLPLFPGQYPALQQKTYGAIIFLAGLTSLDRVRIALSRPWFVRWSRLSFPLYLVHWPILFGPTAALLVVLHEPLGLAWATGVAATVGIALSFAASTLFMPVDRFALNVARWVRRRSEAQSRSFSPRLRAEPAE